MSLYVTSIKATHWQNLPLSVDINAMTTHVINLFQIDTSAEKLISNVIVCRATTKPFASSIEDAKLEKKDSEPTTPALLYQANKKKRGKSKISSPCALGVLALQSLF